MSDGVSTRSTLQQHLLQQQRLPYSGYVTAYQAFSAPSGTGSGFNNETTPPLYFSPDQPASNRPVGEAAHFEVEGSTNADAIRREKRESMLRLVLIALILVSFLCNFDHGVIPAILSEIQKNFNNQIKFVEQSLFGSLVYFGLIIGSLFAGISLQNYQAKWLLVCSLLFLASSLFLFSYANSLLLMYFIRFVTGLCQAVPVVYLPVWVDDYAPEGQVARWMSYTQLAGIGGTVSGYFMGGVVSRFTASGASSGWRMPFFVQSIALVPVIVLLIGLPHQLVNLPDSSQLRPERQRTGLSAMGDLDGAGASCMRNFSLAWTEVKSLLRNPLYVVVTMAMSVLYFVVTGVQFWVTEFLVSVLHFQKLTVVALSTFCFLTAPTSGVWFGGYICDLCGGYRGGGQQRIAVRVTTLFAGIGALLAVTCVHVENFLLFATLLWGCLFFGAALVPVAVGIQLASVPFHQRSISSALSQFAYNMFGWFSAPLVSGVVMDFIDWCHPLGGKELALKYGFEMIMWVSVLGFILFAIANLLTFPSEEIEKDELELQLARTRVPTLSF